MKIFKQHNSVTVLCCLLGSLLPTVTSALPPVPVCWCLCSVSALHHSASVQRGAVPGATGVTHTHPTHGSRVTQIHSVTQLDVQCQVLQVSHTHSRPWEPCHTDTVSHSHGWCHTVTRCHTHIVSDSYIVSHRHRCIVSHRHSYIVSHIERCNAWSSKKLFFYNSMIQSYS